MMESEPIASSARRRLSLLGGTSGSHATLGNDREKPVLSVTSGVSNP